MSVRVFAPPDSATRPGTRLILDGEESHYLLKVRRQRVGAQLQLLDGVGGSWSATLIAAGARAEIEVGETLPDVQTPERVLLLGLPDAPATLESLTLASELAATEVVMVRCARSQGRVPSASRIERVLRAAQRQCGRPQPPAIFGVDEPWPLARALTHRATLPGYFAWEALREADAAPEPHPRGVGLRLLIGPEGGLEEAEVAALRDAGFVPLSLGPWVLRTPTAVTAGLACLLRG